MNEIVEIIDGIPIPKKLLKSPKRRVNVDRRGISIFQEELNFHRAIPGTPYFIARQRAIDYTRRYTRREIPIDTLLSTENDDYSGQHTTLNSVYFEIHPDAMLLQQSNFTDANISPESRALFNDLVRQLFTQFVKLGDDFEDKLFVNSQLDERIATIYLARIIRVGNLEHILNDDLQQIVQRALGSGRTPWTVLDLSILCGYKIRKGSRLDNGFQREITKIQVGLREFLRGRV